MTRKYFFGVQAAVFLVVSSVCQGDVIHDAASSGDLATIRRLLQENPKLVNAQDPAGATPLLWASIKGQLAAAKLFVESGADLNLSRTDGWTPLHGAVCDGQWDANLPVVRLLLDRG